MARPRTLLAGAAATAPAAIALGTAGVSQATPENSPARTGRAVFVQLNSPSGNRVAASARRGDGSLVPVGTFATGGLGGTQVSAPVDPLASQGSLTYDPADQLLFAVNAGSDTFSVFGVSGATLTLRQVLPSRGDFPSSVAVRDGIGYVLNAGGTGSVTGFRVDHRWVRLIGGSTRSLGLANDPVPNFLTSPGQVAISPDGSHLVVTTKANNTVEVFALAAGGRPSAHPVVSAASGPVPYDAVFDHSHLLVVEASGAVTSYRLHADGSLSTISASVPDFGAATCWSFQTGGRLFAVNTGQNTISAYTVARDGTLTLRDAGGVTATTDAAPIDAVATPDGAYAYELNALAGTMGEYAIGDDGSLTRIGTVTGLPVFAGQGMEGIAAS